MDRTSPNEPDRPSSGPTDGDALRLLAVVHQLGEETETGRFRLDGEETLLQLEHLVQQPRLLAHLLIYLFDQTPAWTGRRATLSRRVRQLIELEERRGVRERRRGTLGASLDFPSLAGWRRLDDILATLSMRGLLELGVPSQGGLYFELRAAGATLLDEHFYSEGREAARQLEVSGVIREFLPRWQGAWLAQKLDEARESVAAFRYAEQLPLERPVLPEIFLVTFDERL